MIIKQKLAFYDRLEVARDIVMNIKDDMKLMANKWESEQNYSELTFLALKATDALIEMNKLAQSILLVEEELKKYLEKEIK